MDTIVQRENGQRHILVVEDIETNRRLIEILMRAEGYSVGVAGSGLEALEQAAICRPDVVVLDLALPDMHGSVLIDRLRLAGFDAPVLIVTGDARPASRTAALQAAEYLTKPYDIDSLTKAVARLLEFGR